MTMSYSVSAIRQDRDYSPVRSIEDSADIDQGELIGSSASFQAVLKRVKIVAPTDSVVLIQGEPGREKELIAEAIHNQSSRRNAPFIKMNCAAIPQTCRRANSSGMKKEHSRVRLQRRWAAFSWRTRVRCSWTRSAIFRFNSSPNCCVFYKSRLFQTAT